MTRLPSIRGPFGLALMLLLAACGDGILFPPAVSGYYRLVSVNGQPLPYIAPPSYGLMEAYVWRGDLVLRTNGTFTSGLGGNLSFGFPAHGTYRLSNRELVLRMPGATIDSDVIAQVSGDSISFASPDLVGRPITFTYRRSPLGPSTLPSDRYRLGSVNGRTDEPFVAYDWTIGDTRYVAHVVFDSVVFSEGVFFRRHRSESTIGYVQGQPGTASAQEWTTWGAYESGPGWVVLLHYSPPVTSIRARDSLSIVMDTLVRRTSLVSGILEERYTRP